tara:strand:- start:2398 stop:2931 length:534 start_codon:yes stop_codon:yes gene_type:complete
VKRNLSAIVLIAALISPMFGTLYVIKLERRSIKREVKHRMMEEISKDRLKLLISHPDNESEFDWEHSREFEFQEEMYDVVYSETKGDSTFYWCWEDHEESELNQELTRILLNTLNQKQSNNSRDLQLISYFKSFYTEQEQAFDCSISSRTVELSEKLYSINYTSIQLSLESPPPQLV